MARLELLAAAAVLTPLLLAGCGGDDPEPQLPDTAPSPSSTPSASPAAEATQEPTLPPEAEGNDEAAAEAFVRYYYDVVNYAQATGDVRTLRSLALPACEGCQGGVEYLEGIYQAGGFLKGADYTIQTAEVSAETQSGGTRTFGASLVMSSEAFDIKKSAAEKVRTTPGGISNLYARVAWDKTGFHIATLESS